MRMHPLEQPVSPRFRQPEQPHAIAERRRLGDVRAQQVPDTADGYVVERRLRPERHRRQDRQLVRRIHPVDVEARIGLREPQRLRLGQHFGKVTPFRLHFRQDEIAGTVEDAVDPSDLVRRSPFAQPLDDRNPPRDRRLELQRDPGRFRGLREFQPVMRDHRLVRGDETPPRPQCAPRERQRRTIGAPDQLHHNIRTRLFCQRRRVVDPREPRQIDAAILAPITRRNRDDLDLAPGSPRNQLAVRIQQSDNTAANGPQARKGHAQWFAHFRPPLARPVTFRGRFAQS